MHKLITIATLLAHMAASGMDGGSNNPPIDLNNPPTVPNMTPNYSKTFNAMNTMTSLISVEMVKNNIRPENFSQAQCFEFGYKVTNGCETTSATFLIPNGKMIKLTREVLVANNSNPNSFAEQTDAQGTFSPLINSNLFKAVNNNNQ